VLSPRSAAPEPPSQGEFWPETPIRIAIDPNGNLTQKTENGEVWGYEWNAENELTRVTKDSVEVASFAYDPVRRRIQKAVAGGTHAYVYDGANVLRATYSGGGGQVTRYIHGPEVDEPLAAELGVSPGVTTTYYRGASSVRRMQWARSPRHIGTTLGVCPS